MTQSVTHSIETHSIAFPIIFQPLKKGILTFSFLKLLVEDDGKKPFCLCLVDDEEDTFEKVCKIPKTNQIRSCKEI